MAESEPRRLLTGSDYRSVMFEEFRAAHRAADQVIPSLELLVLDGMASGRNQVDERELRHALMAGSRNGVARAFDVPVFGRKEEEHFRVDLLRGLQLAGQFVHEEILELAEDERERGFRVPVVKQLGGAFNTSHPRAAAWAGRYAADLVTRVGRDTKKGIADIIAASFNEPFSVDEAARRIRPVLLTEGYGLDSTRVKSLVRVAARLAALDLPHDVMVERLARTARALVNQRALVIARTESMRAANGGLQESFLQARDDGLIPRNVKRRWVATPDERTHPGCFMAEALDPVGLEEPFITEAGPLMTPPMHPKCRCTVVLVIGARKG